MRTLAEMNSTVPPNYVPCSQCGRILRVPVGAYGYSHCQDHRGFPNALDFLPDGATYCATEANPQGKPEYTAR